MTTTPASSQWYVSVASASGAGWAYTAWQGMFGDVTDESGLPPVVLVDPLIMEWSYTDEQVPSQLDPSTVTFTLWARAASLLPRALQRGERMSWGLTLFPYGSPAQLHSITGGRVSEAKLTLRPDSAWPARLTVKATDLLVDLPSLTPVQVGNARRRSRERLAQIAKSMSRSVGIPTSTSTQSALPRFTQTWSGDGRAVLSSWGNSAPSIMGGQNAVITPKFGSYPTGYEWAGQSTSGWVGAAIADPASQDKFLMVPAYKPGPTKLPLRFEYVNSLLRLTGAPAADSHSAALDASFLEVPGELRSGREHAPNTFRVTGSAEWFNGTTYNERGAAFEYATADAAATGPRARDVPTQLVLGSYDGSNQDIPNTLTEDLNAITSPFQPDAYAVATSWAPEAFQLLAYAMTDAQARSQLTRLAPAYPGEYGDGQLVRHVTIYNQDPDTLQNPAGIVPQGYVTGGRFQLTQGKMTVGLSMIPGSVASTGTRITVGDVDAASWHAIPAGNIDRKIRVADLALVDA